MVKESCSFEQTVIEGLEKGTLDRDTKRHIEECPVCSDLVMVSGWMTDFQDISMSSTMNRKVLPEPDMVWEKAHSARRVDKALMKKALLPLLVARVVAIAAAIAAVFVLILPNIGGLKRLFNFKAGSGQIVDFVLTAGSTVFKALYVMRLPLLLMGSLFVIYFLITRFDPENA